MELSMKQKILSIVLVLVMVGAAYMAMSNRDTDDDGESDDQAGEETNYLGWTDLNSYKTMLSQRPGRTYSLLPDVDSVSNIDVEDSVLVVVGFDRAPREDEISIIEDHIQSGGNVLVVDDGNLSNILTTPHGVIFDGDTLYETERDQHYLFNPVYLLETAMVNGIGMTLMFNRATGMEVNDSVEVICASSEMRGDLDGPLDYSYYDRNGNGVVDIEDPAPETPLIARVTTSAGGQVVFMSDSGPFTDMMWDQQNNRAFAERLIDSLSGPNGSIFFLDSFQTKDHSNNLEPAGGTFE